MLTAYSVQPSLPFVLLDREAAEAPGSDTPAAASIVIARLDHLHGLLEETRSEVRALRSINEQLLDLVSPDPVLEQGPHTGSLDDRHEADEVPTVDVRLLGAFEIRIGDRSIEGWRSRKPRQLLAYLAMEPDRPVARETLIEVFWPESAPARGANNLSIAVHHIRSRLGELLPAGGGESRGLMVQQGLYRLDPALRWHVDVAAFRGHVGAAKAAASSGAREDAVARAAAAIEAYRGELLESDLAEDWTIDPREHLGGLFQWAASWLAEEAVDAADWQRVLQLGQRLVQRDPGDEAGHRWLIRAHAALGNRGQALRQYRACEEALREEFDVEPSAETRALLAELGL